MNCYTTTNMADFECVHLQYRIFRKRTDMYNLWQSLCTYSIVQSSVPDNITKCTDDQDKEIPQVKHLLAI